MSEKIKKEKSKIDIKETFMQGVLALMLSQIVIKILGFIYTIYLTNRYNYGDRGNAIAGAAYQIYALLLTISSIGVPNAISKLVAEKLAVGDRKSAHRIFKISLITFAIIGFIGSALLFFGADVIATNWMDMPAAKHTLVSLSPAIFFVSIGSVFRGYCNANKKMKITARSQTLEQLFKAALTIGVVEIVAFYTKSDTSWMAAGATLATTLATLSSFAYLLFYYKARKEEFNQVEQKVIYKPERIKTIVKNILFVSLPMSLSSLMSAINKNIDSLTVIKGLKKIPGVTQEFAESQLGILNGKIDTLTSVPLSFNVAFATALVPAVAASLIKGDRQTATKRISFSIMITMLIGLPCTVGMIVFAKQILELLFPHAMSGVLLLQLSAVTIIFTILAQTVNGALQGLGKVMIPATALGCGVIAKLICNSLLIPQIGAAGAAIGSICCHIISFNIGFAVLRKNIELNLSFDKFVLKPIIATAMMSIVSYAAYYLLLTSRILPENIDIIIALIVAVIVYVVAILVLKVLTKEDIHMMPQGSKIYGLLQKIGVYE